MELVTPVAVCIVRKDGRILFIRREGKTFGGLLSLPGGKIDFGETLEGAAERELEEETGVRSRFRKNLATIPEHVVENGKVVKHLMIQLCEMEYIEEKGQREFESHWLEEEELDSRKVEFTPSDRLMVKEILMKGRQGGHFSVIERTEQGYLQKEFREIG